MLGFITIFGKCEWPLQNSESAPSRLLVLYQPPLRATEFPVSYIIELTIEALSEMLFIHKNLAEMSCMLAMVRQRQPIAKALDVWILASWDDLVDNVCPCHRFESLVHEVAKHIPIQYFVLFDSLRISPRPSRMKTQRCHIIDMKAFDNKCEPYSSLL